MERPGLALRCAGAPRPGITGLRVDGCVRGPHRSVQQQETSVHEKQLNVSHGHMTEAARWRDRKSTRLNSSHLVISYAVFCLKKKKITVAKKYTTIWVVDDSS